MPRYDFVNSGGERARVCGAAAAPGVRMEYGMGVEVCVVNDAPTPRQGSPSPCGPSHKMNPLAARDSASSTTAAMRPESSAASAPAKSTAASTVSL